MPEAEDTSAPQNGPPGADREPRPAVDPMEVDVTPHWQAWAEGFARMDSAERDQALRSLTAEQRAHFDRVWEALGPQLTARPDGSEEAGEATEKSPRSERRYRRLAREFDVSFSKSGGSVSYKGKAGNISAGGMRLTFESEGRQPVGTRLQIKIKASEDGFVVEGEVVHSGASEMGVRFIPLTELVAPLLVPRVDEEDETGGTETLSAELGIYKLSYDSPKEFHAVHDSILETGRVLVSTPHPSPLGKEIRVEISLAYAAEAGPVRLATRVVKSFQGEMGVMGVEITNLQSASYDLKRLRSASDRIAGRPG